MATARTFRRRILDQSALSSNLIVGLILIAFVGLVIAGLVVAYILPSPAPTSSGFSGITVSELILYSGPGSKLSYNQGCNVNEASLQVYVTNNSTSTINLTNETFYGGYLSHNATALVPVSSGCLPIAQSIAPITAGQDDLVISSYPDVNLPLGSSCYVNIQFSNGQNLTQLLVAQSE
jgi:hypothetical protein